jgi:hypothetical protein
MFARERDEAAEELTQEQRTLLQRRDRLAERFTAIQLDLGGAYYEMAIRDHMRHDVLLGKAAELQRVDAELKAVEQVLRGDGARAPRCPHCEAVCASGTSNCWHCGKPLA